MVGAHLRNEAVLQRADLELYDKMKGQCVLAFDYQDPKVVVPFAGGIKDVICRLPNSFDNNRVLGLLELEQKYQQAIDKWYAQGVRLFVVDNEPNESWASVTPPPGKTRQWYWAWLMRRVLRSLSIPEDVTLLLPPVSMPTLNGAWVEEMYVTEPGFPSVAAYCGAAAAHCYWQAEGDMEASWAGRSYRWLHERTGLDIYITEAGCSTAHDTEARQAHDYPIYCHKVAEDSYVRSLTFFILGSNGGWKLFELTDKVCASVGNRAAHSEGGR